MRKVLAEIRPKASIQNLAFILHAIEKEGCPVVLNQRKDGISWFILSKGDV
jgi:hypothetical protein